MLLHLVIQLNIPWGSRKLIVPSQLLPAVYSPKLKVGDALMRFVGPPQLVTHSWRLQRKSALGWKLPLGAFHTNAALDRE